jgi:hypothetical protein
MEARKMSTAYAHDKDGKVTAIITLADFYHFEGFTFSLHRYLGPQKLRKDFEPARKEGRKFYAAIDRWMKLSNDEKENTRV